MTLAQQLESLAVYEDSLKAHWVDEPDNYLPEDTDGEPVEVGAKYWKAYSNYVLDDEDSIANFLKAEGYDEHEYAYGYQALIDDYFATLVTFDYEGYEHGARRDD